MQFHLEMHQQGFMSVTADNKKQQKMSTSTVSTPQGFTRLAADESKAIFVSKSTWQ